MSILQFKYDDKNIIARAIDESTAQANVKALFNALNLIEGVNK